MTVTEVRIGGTPATGLTVVNATTLRCATPPGTAGAADVEVEGPDGVGTLPDAFTYHPLLTVTAVDPNSGPVAGGTAVTVTGTGFVEAEVHRVTFGGIVASDFQVVNETTITCVTLEHGQPETVYVRATGTQVIGTLPDAFTFTG